MTRRRPKSRVFCCHPVQYSSANTNSRAAESGLSGLIRVQSLAQASRFPWVSEAQRDHAGRQPTTKKKNNKKEQKKLLLLSNLIRSGNVKSAPLYSTMIHQSTRGARHYSKTYSTVLVLYDRKQKVLQSFSFYWHSKSAPCNPNPPTQATTKLHLSPKSVLI
jgi:hypothetical protein